VNSKRSRASRPELRALRQAAMTVELRPLSQVRIGERLGLSQPTVSRLMRGESPMTDERLARISEITDRAAKLREIINPIASILIDGEIAAKEPTLLIREAKILIDGSEGIIEELRACVDLAEFDVLEKVLHMARARLAEIKAALSPYMSEPS
jgi:transcriptional regulator with XRE-family HTH domain